MTPATTPFGRRLKQWRQMRSVSQLDLSSRIGTTPRHLSFLETGRSRPSREMVQRLAAGLDLPLRDHNDMLRSAGFDASYPEQDLRDEELAPFRVMIERLLSTHEPYPALVIDRWWNITEVNNAARLFVPQVPISAVDLFLAPGSLREAIDNFEELAPVILSRLEADAAEASGDDQLADLVLKARSMVGELDRSVRSTTVPAIPVRIRFGDLVLTMVSALARFESTTEVTLSELRVELFYPLDDATNDALHMLAGTG